MSGYLETLVKPFVASKHDTTISRFNTNDNLIINGHSGIDSKLNTVLSDTGGSGAILQDNNSKLDTVKANTDTTESQLGTIKVYTEDLDSKHDTTHSLLNTITGSSNVQSRLDTIDSVTGSTNTIASDNNSKLITLNTSIGASTNDSKLETLKTGQTGLNSRHNTNISRHDTNISRIDEETLQLERLFFKRTTGVLSSAFENEGEESFAGVTSTSFGIVSSQVFGDNFVSPQPTEYVNIDVGWTGQTDSGTGETKLMAVAGITPTLVGAVDVSDVVVEGTVKGSRFRSGQLNLAVFNNMPFVLMLVARSVTGANTLTVGGIRASSVAVAYDRS